MRKRSVVSSLIAVTAVLAATGLGACSSPSTAPTPTETGAQQVTLNALFMKQTGLTQDKISSMIFQFEADNPTITIDPTFVEYDDLHDTIVSSASTGAYDVVLMDVIWPAEFASKGIVLDVTDRYPASWEQDMLGGVYTTAKYDDRFYGVPRGPSTKFLYYNKDMVAAVGATEADLNTWDGVMAVAQKIKDAKLVQYPFAWSWSPSEALVCDYGQLLGAFGGQFTDSSGTLAVNSAEGVQTMTWMKHTLDAGLSNPSSMTFLEEDVANAMAQGQAAFSLNWEAFFAVLQDPTQSQVVGKIGILPTPEGPTGARPGINGTTALSIMANSAHPDQDWQLITYLTSQPVQNQYTSGWLPIWKSSYTDPTVTARSPELFAAAETGYADLIYRPTVVNYDSVSTALQAEIESALLGNKTPGQAMNDAVQEASTG